MKLYCAFCLKPFEGKNGAEFCSPKHRAEQVKAEREELKNKRTQLRLPANHHFGNTVCVGIGARLSLNLGLSDTPQNEND